MGRYRYAPEPDSGSCCSCSILVYQYVSHQIAIDTNLPEKESLPRRSNLLLETGDMAITQRKHMTSEMSSQTTMPREKHKITYNSFLSFLWHTALSRAHPGSKPKLVFIFFSQKRKKNSDSWATFFFKFYYFLQCCLHV